jgi:hypothetical protein
MRKKLIFIFPLLLVLSVFLAAYHSNVLRNNGNYHDVNPPIQLADNSLTNNTNPDDFDNSDIPAVDPANCEDVPSDWQFNNPVNYNPDAIYRPNADQKVIDVDLNDILG